VSFDAPDITGQGCNERPLGVFRGRRSMHLCASGELQFLFTFNIAETTGKHAPVSRRGVRREPRGVGPTAARIFILRRPVGVSRPFAAR